MPVYFFELKNLMIIKRLFQIITVLSCIYLAPASFAQYKMPEELPICKDSKTMANELPSLSETDYPAKHYSNAKLIERIIDLVNDPSITPKELEAEFGLKFFECTLAFPHIKNDVPSHRFVSKGQFPLGSDSLGASFASFESFNPRTLAFGKRQSSRRTVIDVIYEKNTIGGHFISINFNQLANDPKESNLIDCVYRDQIIERLDEKWLSEEQFHPYYIIYEKKNKLFKHTFIISDKYVALPYCKNEGVVDYLYVSFSPNL